MADDISKMFDNVKKIVDNGNIPDNLKDLLKNLNSSNDDISSLISNSKSSSSESSNSNKTNNINMDIKTFIKMKNIIDTINKKDDPRANLLHSLKPYLRESRKEKIEQYVNLLNMTKIADILKKENNSNG